MARSATVRSPSHAPAYTIADAARFLHVPLSTLRFWVKGGHYPTRSGRRAFAQPIIRLVDPDYLSFVNLAESYVLRGLRRRNQIPLPKLRSAVVWLAKELRDSHPLIHPDIRAHGGSLLVDRYGKLIDTSPEGQLAMREVFEAHLERLVWRDREVVRLFPFTRGHEGPPHRDEPQFIMIDPDVSYGRPVLTGGIRTAIINERFLAGEDFRQIADDYERPVEEIQEAIRYEGVGAKHEEAA